MNLQSQITLSKIPASSKMRQTCKMRRLKKMSKKSQIKSLSQLSHQLHAVPQILQSINSLIINILSKESHCPNIAKNIVKKFMGHFTHNSVNQPIKRQILSHVPHHSIQKSATSKESPKINHLKISQLAHLSRCPNIVKNFVGHFTHKSVNQPIKCQKLSHALSQICSTQCHNSIRMSKTSFQASPLMSQILAIFASSFKLIRIILYIMALQCGIVGLPNVGKSTLFNCLSSAKAQAANFPFCTIEPNVGVITVPDERLNKLAEIVHPGRIVPTTVEIVDIAGLVKGASKGEGLGNKFLANIRETDAIIHVLRCFDDDNVTHVDGSIDPVRDKEIIDCELQLRDLETVESRISKVQKQAQTGGDKEAKMQYEVLKQYMDALQEGKSARTITLESKDAQRFAHDLFLLTNKPVLYVCNVDDAAAVNGNHYVDAVREAVKDEDAEILVVAAKTESEIAELDTYEDRQMFLEEIGLKESGMSRLIRSAYSLLNLQTFITAGPMEVRAWTYHKGDKAPQCAGVIHTDFEKGFIRAEIIKYDDYIHYGSEVAVKEAGKMHVEGKEYEMQDGDIVYFRFNV
jgi:GTP-binding protein YchF